jgi:hypothetical protein
MVSGLYFDKDHVKKGGGSDDEKGYHLRQSRLTIYRES